jgi:hypothetical protein
MEVAGGVFHSSSRFELLIQDRARWMSHGGARFSDRPYPALEPASSALARRLAGQKISWAIEEQIFGMGKQ